MAQSIIAGFNGATFQGNVFTYNPRGGYTAGHSFSGPVGVMRQEQAALVATRAAFRYTESGGVGTITIDGNVAVDNGASEAPIDSWQLLGNEIHKDIYESDLALGIEDAQRGSLGKVRKAIDRYNNGEDPGALTITASQVANGNKLIDLLMRGVTHFPVKAPVLRHTQNVSDRYSGEGFAFSNQGRIYTKIQLLAECNAFPLPPPKVILDQINGLENPTARTGYLIGWRKKPVDTQTAAQYRSEVVTEYCFDQWSTSIFTAAA